MGSVFVAVCEVESTERQCVRVIDAASSPISPVPRVRQLRSLVPMRSVFSLPHYGVCPDLRPPRYGVCPDFPTVCVRVFRYDGVCPGFPVW